MSVSLNTLVSLNDFSSPLLPPHALITPQLDIKQDNANARAKIPGWMFILLAVFGFNEIMTVLRNPFMLVVLVGGATWMYYTFVLDQGGPTKSILKGILDTSVSLIDTQFPNESDAPAMVSSFRSSISDLSEHIVPSSSTTSLASSASSEVEEPEETEVESEQKTTPPVSPSRSHSSPSTKTPSTVKRRPRKVD